MRCEFNFADGSTNLDLTTKILRVVGKETKRFGDSNTGISNALDYTTNNRYRFYGLDSYSSIEGTKPDIPKRPNHILTPNGDDFCITSGQDNVTYWDTGQGLFANIQNSLMYRSYPIESWANEMPTKYKDYFKVRNEQGQLMWSTGSLGDAIVRTTRVVFNSVESVKEITSQNNRRLHILLTDSFKSGTYVEDEGGSLWSASGLQFRWSNNGRTLRMAYASYNDNDIYYYFNSGKVINLTIFERYDD